MCTVAANKAADLAARERERGKRKALNHSARAAFARAASHKNVMARFSFIHSHAFLCSALLCCGVVVLPCGKFESGDENGFLVGLVSLCFLVLLPSTVVQQHSQRGTRSSVLVIESPMILFALIPDQENQMRLQQLENADR